jgi:hypothetical protein
MPPSHFYQKKTGFGISTSNTCKVELKDTVGTTCLITKFDIQTEFSQNDKVFDTDKWKYKSTYIKYKGLVYFEETKDNDRNIYKLVD